MNFITLRARPTVNLSSSESSSIPNKDGGDEGHGEHVPHHDLPLLGARHPARDVSVLRAGHVVVLAISTVVSLGDHPCGKTFLFRLLLLKNVVEVDEYKLHDDLGTELNDKPEANCWGPDNFDKAVLISCHFSLLTRCTNFLLLLFQ